MSCKDKLTNLTISTTNAREIDYTDPLGTNTKIEEPCVNQSEVNQDLYSLVDDIFIDLSTEDLGDLSITFPETDGKILFSDVIKQYEIEIDKLKTDLSTVQSEDICNTSILNCGIDLTEVTDKCSTPVTTLGDLLSVIVDNTNFITP